MNDILIIKMSSRTSPIAVRHAAMVPTIAATVPTTIAAAIPTIAATAIATTVIASCKPKRKIIYNE